MESGTNELRNFAAMQVNKPFKTYVKTILGKVYLTVLDPFSGQPVGILLEGNPRKNEESAVYDAWSEIDDMFFRKTNKGYFQSGTIIEYTRPVEETKEKSIEAYTDEEMKDVINQKYLALQAQLNKIESEAVLFRMLSIAREIEKSEKIIGAIQARLSEVQTLKVTTSEEE